ncbi:MAG: alpha/beta hydrolase fold domain-containing protein [Planctomycetota bacterium]
MRTLPRRRLLALATLLVAAAAPAQTVRTPDLVYGTWTDGGGVPHDLLLDLYLPATQPAQPMPLVVWVHGGGWQGGTKFPAPAGATRLVARGYAVASIDYRLSGTAIWPAQIHDCKAAIRFLRANAAGWNVDPDRIGVFGSSAGGHLVGALATMGGQGPTRVGSFAVDLEGAVGAHTTTSSRVQASCPQFGPTNMLHAHDFPTFDHDAANSPESRLIGAALPLAPERWATVDPVSFVSRDDAPLLLMHGTDDTTVPFHQSELMLAASRAIGHDATLFAVQDNGHGGPGFSAPAAVAAIDAFFDRTLLLLPDVRVSVVATDPVADEAGDPAAFTVARTGAVAGPLQVRLWLTGDVTPGEDCDPVPLLVTIPAGASAVTVPLVPRDDALVEGPERATLVVCASPDYRIDHAADSAAATLADDDGAATTPVVTVVAIDASAGEVADPGAFRVTRTGPVTAPLVVRYHLDGSATPDIDLLPLPGAVTIPAGAPGAVVVVLPRDDTEVEASETVILTLRADAGYARGADASAHAVLADDDRPASLPVVSVIGTDPDLGEAAGAGAFTLTRTGPIGQALLVRFATTGTAAPAADFTPLASSAFIPAGSAWVRIPVQPIDDALVEGTERLTLNLLPDPAYALGTAARHTLSLQDDEAPTPNTTLDLAMAPMHLGEPATVTLADGEPLAPWSLWVANAPAYLPWMPFGIIQLDPAGTAFVAAGLLDTDAAATMSLAVPPTADFRGLEVVFQALALQSAAPNLTLSNATARTIH